MFNEVVNKPKQSLLASSISNPANSYLFKVDNRNTKKGVKYVQN